MDIPSQSSELVAQIIRDEAAWDALRVEWSALFDVSPRAATPLHFDWLRTWWRVYGESHRGPGGGLRVIALRRGPRLVGVLPLYLAVGGPAIGVRCLRFLSTGEKEWEETCPEYLDLLSLPGEDESCMTAIRRVLAGSTWDLLELTDLRDGSPLAGLDGSRLVRENYCPVANLEGGFESYLRRLSANSRQQARRLIREGERGGIAFELAREPQQSEEFFSDLIRLHQDRWVADGKPGCFASARFTEFHRELLRQWLPAGRAVLARLRVSGQTVAALYGFVTGPKFDFYQSGVRMSDDGPLRSPGNLAHLLLMRELAEAGVTHYDFLRGQSSYKLRLATDQNRLYSVGVWRPTLRSAVHRTARLLRRTVHRGLRTLRMTRSAPAQQP